jgi:predicted dehydrogenase
VDNLVKNIGIVGVSEGNGHPFSFSAIINGYSDSGLASSGWGGIYEYVRRRDPSEFGIEGLRVTHAWTQDVEVTAKLCKACLIPNQVANLEDMLGAVDAIIIARDDYENHFSMAMPFLKLGIPVFVDKPLSLLPTELTTLRPFLESGKLMSCSGMRFARELDVPRATISEYGRMKLVRGAIVLSWEKYGVHLLDAIFGILASSPNSVEACAAPHTSISVHMDDGMLLQIDALGEAPRTFQIDIWGTDRSSSHEILDNFSMFRRMLWRFARSLTDKAPAIPVEDTLKVMRVLIAGRMAMKERRLVSLDEITI